MRVTILGAGAIGAPLGAALATRAGADVTLVARGARASALREGGVRLTGAFGERVVKLPVTDAPPGDADVTVVAVKTPDLASALDAVAARVPHGLVVTLQNGLHAEAAALERFPEERVLGCITVFDAHAGDGDAARGLEVHVSDRMGGVVLGRARGPADARVTALADAWRRALPVHVTNDLPGARWTKLLVNLNNGIPAVTGLSIQDAFRDPRLARLSARLLKEAVAVARAEGARLAPLPAVHPRLVHALARLPVALAARALAFRARRVLGDDPAHGSTWQSVTRGKRSEIDALHGEVVKRGRAKRVSVAANAAVVRGVKRVAADGRFWSVDRLLAEVRPED